MSKSHKHISMCECKSSQVDSFLHKNVVKGGFEYKKVS